MSERATAENLFLQDFAANAATLPGAGVPWLDARRAEAIKLVRANGIPNRRVEAWKYSDLRNALSDGMAGVVGWKLEGATDAVEIFDLANLDTGAPGWVVQNLGMVVPSRGTIDAASLALARSGVAIRIPSGIALSAPLRIAYSGSGHARVLVVLEPNSSATFIETNSGVTADSRNIGLEFIVDARAKLTHLNFEESVDTGARVSVEEVSVLVRAAGRYAGHYFGLGSKLARMEAEIVLSGAGAEAHLSGAGVLHDERHYDVTTHIDHAWADTRSTQLFKNIAAGHSRAVYQGKVTVREGAIGSDSNQAAKALLLSDRAEADLKPELEILADDVKCAHGAAVGDLDADSLFYLRSRGIPESDARTMLVRAFLKEAVDRIEGESLRAQAWQFVERGLVDAMRASP